MVPGSNKCFFLWYVTRFAAFPRTPPKRCFRGIVIEGLKLPRVLVDRSMVRRKET